MAALKKISENIWQIEKEDKIYKPLNLVNLSNRKIVSMIPGDRKVAGCLIYSICFMDGAWKKF